MKILYIAYSCNPYNGSEDQIGWNIPYESAKIGNKVYVITKEEQKNSIEKYCKQNNYYNINFIYVDIPSIYKKIFNGFFYSGRLNKWNCKAFIAAKKLVDEEAIDIIHQLTPVELRAIGSYGKINNSKFIVGPIGGGSYIPKQLRSYAKKNNIVEIIRNTMNKLSIVKYYFNKNIHNIDYLLFSNEETKNYFKNIKNGELYTEIGIKEEIISKKNILRKKKDITFLVAGRLIYIKGHQLLFDVIEKIPDNYKYKTIIIGNGKMYDKLQKRINNSEILKKHVILKCGIPFNEMLKEYQKCDALIMPSIRENTGTVIIEALSNGKPVIAMNKFGAKVILNNGCAWLYYGKTKNEMINSLKECIEEVINNSDELSNKSKEALKTAYSNTWKEKCNKYQKIYDNLLGK